MKRVLLLALLALAAVRADPLRVTAVGDTRPMAASSLRLSGDVVFANFEGALGPAGPDPWRFFIPPEAPAWLRAMGVSVVSLANNHSHDLGAEGYQRSRQELTGAGIQVATPEGVTLTASGRRVRVVAVSFEDLGAPARQPEDDILIVSAHMGGEGPRSHLISPGMEHFGDQPRGDVVAFSHGCIDRGADLVLGHGPHLPRGLELYRGKLIAYSLGNFLFAYPGSQDSLHAPGYALSVELDEQGNFASARIDSYDLVRGVPVPDGEQHAYRLIAELTRSNLGCQQLEFPGDGRVTRRKP